MHGSLDDIRLVQGWLTDIRIGLSSLLAGVVTTVFLLSASYLANAGSQAHVLMQGWPTGIRIECFSAVGFYDRHRQRRLDRSSSEA